MGAGAIASNLYGASGDEEFDFDEGSVRYENWATGCDVLINNTRFRELSVEAALANEDENSRRLKAELEALKQQEVLLQTRAESDQLRKQLAVQRAKVAKLRGNNIETESRAKIGENARKLKKTVSQKNQSQTLLDDNDIDIVKLRKNKHLKKRVRKQMKKLGLDDNSDADESQISDSESDVNLSESEAEISQISKISRNRKSKKSRKGKKICKSSDSDSNLSFSSSNSDSDKKKKKNKHKKSGIKAKASDSVKFPQKYPQAFLRYEFVSENVSFEKLDLNLFVCTELEIISDKKVKEPGKSGRLKLLKKIMYNCSSYEFSTLKSFYAACLQEIEVGKKNLGR